MPKQREHAVDLTDQKLLCQIKEVVEDRLADTFEHYKDKSVMNKPTTITVTLTVTPTDTRNEKFVIQVGDKMGLAPRGALLTPIYPHTNSAGQIELLRNDPDDLALPYDDPEPAARR